MCAKMTRERAKEFGAAWNSRDADLVTSFFAENGVYHASVGPDALGKSYIGKDHIRRGVQAFFDRYPDGEFENLKVVVAGEIGTFEWDFVTTDSSGQKVRTAGCDLLQFVDGQGSSQERLSQTTRVDSKESPKGEADWASYQRPSRSDWHPASGSRGVVWPLVGMALLIVGLCETEKACH